MASRELQRPMKIFVGVDGSEHSFAAIHLLKDLPLDPRVCITILAVLIPRDASSFASRMALLEDIQAKLREKGVEVNTELLTGYPGEMLTLYAEEHHPDMFVLGAKGLRATLGILLGGVAQQMVEYARWPVLIVRAPYKHLRQVLFVTDGSTYSQCAGDYLARFPLPEGASVRVMHVLPPLPNTFVNVFPGGAQLPPELPSPEVERISAELAEEELEEGKALLDQTVSRLKSIGLVADSVLRRGDAVTEIIQYVKDHDIDLVVTGSRGLSQLRGLLLGSVSRKLVHYAGRSVLVVKGG